VPNPLAPQALQFDPQFLSALDRLSRLGAQLCAQGDAGYRFELMPQPVKDVTRTELTIDRQQVVYYNQRETWSDLKWPGNGLNGYTSLTWQSISAGTRLAFESTGDWAFLRLLEQAEVKQLDSTRYALTWQQPDAQALQYVLRTQVGAGPLDLLKLRGFKMPSRVFAPGASPNLGAVPAALPPLPPLLQEPHI
jgi:type VI secretion system protein ImpL